MTNLYFKTQVDKIEDLLFGFAMKLTKNRENAKDLMQETLMRGFQARDRFKIGTHFKSWMTTIMYNSFINHYRKQKTRNRVEQPVEDIVHLSNKATTEGSGEQIILREELDRILNQLDLKYKKPFLMFFKGFQYDEIAEDMELPIGTVKSRIFYARKQLKAMIVDQYGTENLRRA
jgi:RNA polymerase sigma-70 factor (ECF subfamily)